MVLCLASNFLHAKVAFLNLSSLSFSFLSLPRIWITSVLALANWCNAIFYSNVDYFSIALAAEVDFQEIMSLQFHTKGYQIKILLRFKVEIRIVKMH